MLLRKNSLGSKYVSVSANNINSRGASSIGTGLTWAVGTEQSKVCNIPSARWMSALRRGFGFQIWIICHLNSPLVTMLSYTATVNVHNSLITTAYCVFKSNCLATASNNDYSSAQVLSECLLPCNCLFSSNSRTDLTRLPQFYFLYPLCANRVENTISRVPLLLHGHLLSRESVYLAVA
jgi:hypothetical protein